MSFRVNRQISGMEVPAFSFMCLAAGIFIHVQGHTYLGQYVSSDTWDAIHAASVSEIVSFSRFDADCGVVISSSRASNGEWKPHPFLSWPISAESRAGVSILKEFVSDVTDAKWACYTLWVCAIVEVYSVPNTLTLAAYYYSTPEGNGTWTTTIDGSSQIPTPTPAPSRWVASFTINRTLGYACPNAGFGGSIPDPGFLFDTYIGFGNGSRYEALVSAGALPGLLDLGLPVGRAASYADIRAAADSIGWYFVSRAHMWRLWPNAACALTPIHRDPSTGCSRARCPTFTVCPTGFRTNVLAWGTCFPSLNSSEQEVVLDGTPLRFATATRQLTMPLASSPDSIDNDTRSTIMLDASAVIETRNPVGAILPCNPGGVGLGICAHYSAWTGVSQNNTAVCACTPISGPGGAIVVGDTACQLSPAACFPEGTPVSEWAEDGVCSGHGTCTFTRSRINWYVINIGSPMSGAVTCSCELPWAGALCAHTWCQNTVTGADCHASGRGICTSDPNVSPSTAPSTWTWVCKCTFPYFGNDCEFEDRLLTGSSAVTAFSLPTQGGDVVSASTIRGRVSDGGYSCWVEAWRVQNPLGGPSARGLLLCANRGVCTASVGVSSSNSTSQSRAGTCVCEDGWTGPRCEWAQCTHRETCGLYGRCFADVDTTGRAFMRCVCATHEIQTGMVLARPESTRTSRCDVALCGGGSLVLTFGKVQGGDSGSLSSPGVVPDWDMRTVPRGTCVCTSAMINAGPPGPDALPRVITDRFGLPHVLQWPSHAFLPTLIDPNVTLSPDTGEVIKETPYAYIPTITLSNTGPRCEVPACPMYANPISGVPAPASSTYPCGADAATWSAVCVPCGSPGGSSAGSFCTFSGGTGGYCDCDGGAWDATHDVPYYLGEWASRWTAPSSPLNPMCEPYCKNGGLWSPSTATCLCSGTGHWGPTCNISRCPRGTPSLGSGRNCSSCPLGWDVASDCTACSRGYTGADCTQCSFGYFGIGVPRVCVACGDAATTLCQPPGSNGYVCTDTGPVCTCGLGYTNGVAGPCSACANGYSMVTVSGVRTCKTCADAAGCSKVYTKRAVCGISPVCECKVPFMNSLCTGCDSAHRMVGSGAAMTCADCATSLGCNPLGTLNATCYATAPSRDACTCNTEAGFAGPKCASCAPGWRQIGGSCAKCGQDGGACGPWGTLDCSLSPPVCACSYGMGGTRCDTCTACGIGGTCALNTSIGAPWCQCRPGFTKLGGEANVTAPCSVCAQGVAIVDPLTRTCVPVTQVCGTGIGVNVLSTSIANNMSRCICFPGFAGRACTECMAGFAGPACIPCPGVDYVRGAPSESNGTCIWDAVARAAKWSCVPGVSGEACDRCAAGWIGSNSANPELPPCIQCPPCGRGGVCSAPSISDPYHATCSCLTGFTRLTPGNSSAPCNVCEPGTSPVHCLPCTGCVYSQRCADPPNPSSADAGVCTCVSGYRVLTGVQEGAGVHCFPVDVAIHLEAISSQTEDPITTRTSLSLLGPNAIPPTPLPRWSVFAYAHSITGYIWLLLTSMGVVIVSLIVSVVVYVAPSRVRIA